MAENSRPSFEETLARPEGKALAECAAQVRTIAERLEEIAWSLSVREVGRTLAHFARHLGEDAQRLDMLALMVPALESMPDDKKDETNAMKKKVERLAGGEKQA